MTWLIDTNIILEIRKGRRADPMVAGWWDKVADIWGRISARRSVPVIDGLLAATAIAHDLVLVTRNVADVDGLGAQLLNPFAPS